MLLLANEDTKINVVDSAFKFLNAPDYNTMLDTVETAYRNCYKSENNKDTVETFIKTKLNAGHESPIEHCVISVIMTVDRGVSHELVRHRIASYSQSSTRYCNYSKDKFGHCVTYVKPTFLSDDVIGEWNCSNFNKEFGGYVSNEGFFVESCLSNADDYFSALKMNWKPEQARVFLMNALATDVVVTMNIRSWRHFFELRALGTTGRPHPDMFKISKDMLISFAKEYPVFFGDLLEKLTEKERN